MAKNKVDACIFCNAAPCECGKPAKKSAPKKKRAVPYVEHLGEIPRGINTVTPNRRSGLSSMKSMAAKAELNKEPEKVDAELEAVLGDTDWILAIQALDGMLQPEEQRRWAPVFEIKLDQKQRGET